MSVRAAVLSRFNEPLEIQDFPDPNEAGAGEALVRVEMAGICGTDVHLWLGQLPIPVPLIMGHETVGRLEIVGEGLTKDWLGVPLKVGDRVCWASSIACGECFYCRRKGQPTRCLTRKAYGISYSSNDAPHLRGGYAEKILLRGGTALFRIPDEIPTEAVVGAGCALTTAIHGLERAPVAWGDTVVIQGSGPVGMAVLAVAKAAGAAKLIVVGGPAHRLEQARQFGATCVIDIDDVPDHAARRELVLNETEGFGADVVVECVGHPSAVPEGLDYCRDGANFLVLGQYANAGEVLLNPHIITRKQLRVIGSWGFEPRHVARALEMLQEPHWSQLFAKQITHKFPLTQANEALQTTRAWLSGKTVIVP